MINFTEYIGFFWHFDILLGGQTDRFHWKYWFFSTFRLFEFSTSCWEFKLIDFTEYIEFFDLSTFRPRGGRSTSWREVKKINFTEYIVFFRLFNLLLGGQSYQFYWYIGFFRLFDFSTCCCEVKLIDFNEYI